VLGRFLKLPRLVRILWILAALMALNMLVRFA
jgi:hypothetical protein